MTNLLSFVKRHAGPTWLATAVVLLVVVLLRSQWFVRYLYVSWAPTVFTPTMVCTAAGARAGLAATLARGTRAVGA